MSKSQTSTGRVQGKPNRQQRRREVREQPQKDSNSKRVNFDNERDSKFLEWLKSAKAKDCNDVAWYAHNAELLRSAASLPFSTTQGLPILGGKWAVPGVMQLLWTPFVDGGNGAAIQQAANSIYSYVVHANSRNYNYDPADLMIMILAGANVFAGLAMGIRAYGTARKYDQQNYYTPEALLKAMGFYPDDVRNNLSQVWFDLNTLVAKVRQIWIPNVMPVIERWFWMSTNIYTDSSSAKAQFYVFSPQMLYRFQETASETGSSLDVLPWGGALHKWSEYMTYMNSMIDNLLNSQDRGMIFGDILNAYGADKLYAVSDIAADYEVTPVYNPEVLSQIENATVCPAQIIGISQDANGNLKSEFGYVNLVTADPFNGLGQSILNFHQLTPPTPEQIMVATRLKTMGLIFLGKQTTEALTTYCVRPEIAGTEYLSSIKVYYKDWTSATPTDVASAFPAFVVGSTMNVKPLYMWSTFDWCPWIYNYPVALDLSTATVGSVIRNVPNYAYGDYDNYTTIEPDVLQKMHTTAVYSEFGVPTSI